MAINGDMSDGDTVPLVMTNLQACCINGTSNMTSAPQAQ